MHRLLLIEDDVDISTLLARYLQRSGYEVVCATDGREGVHAFLHGDYDVVLVDGLLPHMNGFEVVAAIRAMPKAAGVGVIMVTAAFRTPRAKKDALEGGVDAFFTKPFVLNDLREKIRELAARRGHTTPAAARTPAPTSEAAVAPPPPPVQLLPPHADVQAPAEVASLLLSCARNRLSGTVHFAAEASSLVIAFIHGVVVGAGDNLREELLGERLWRQGRLSTEQMRALNTRLAMTGERVAEALLALGLFSAEEMLATMAEQTRARVRRALLWTGKATIVEDPADAHVRAVESVDVVEIIVAFALEEAQAQEAARFVAQHNERRIVRGSGFEQLLTSLAHVKPDAALPALILREETQTRGVVVGHAAAHVTARELWAALLIGLVRFHDEQDRDGRALPDLLRLDFGHALVDRELANRICALLLKARGRSIYGLLGISRSSEADFVLDQIAALEDEVGPAAVAGRTLGPVMSAARELWSQLADSKATIADPIARLLYDSALEGHATASMFAPSTSSEDKFLEGQLALAKGDAKAARGFFQICAHARPRDAEYASHLGWTEILSGNEGDGVRRLMKVMREHPQSMRPMFFLGLHSARSGEIEKARALLNECLRRSPHDFEVAAALSALT